MAEQNPTPQPKDDPITRLAKAVETMNGLVQSLIPLSSLWIEKMNQIRSEMKRANVIELDRMNYNKFMDSARGKFLAAEREMKKKKGQRDGRPQAGPQGKEDHPSGRPAVPQPTPGGEVSVPKVPETHNE